MTIVRLTLITLERQNVMQDQTKYTNLNERFGEGLSTERDNEKRTKRGKQRQKLNFKEQRNRI